MSDNYWRDEMMHQRLAGEAEARDLQRRCRYSELHACDETCKDGCRVLRVIEPNSSKICPKFVFLDLNSEPWLVHKGWLHRWNRGAKCWVTVREICGSELGEMEKRRLKPEHAALYGPPYLEFPVGSRWRTDDGIEITVTQYFEMMPGCWRLVYDGPNGSGGSMGQNHIDRLTPLDAP